MQTSEPEHSPKRSILLVSEPGVDGVFQYVKQLADYLIAARWRVHLAYSSLRSCPELFDLVKRVDAAGGRTVDLLVGNSPRAGDLRALSQLRSLAHAVRPDAIHAHSSKAGALARILPLLGVRAAFFYTPHGYFQLHLPMDARKRFFTTIERVLGRVGRTIATSASEEQYARTTIGISPERLSINVTGVDCERFHPPEDAAVKRAARVRFGLPPDALLLGAVARYSEQKDPLTLYRALLDSLAKHPELYFAHLGRGELSGEVDGLLNTAPAGIRARIFRIDASHDTATFYRALDAFTLPSRFEGFALSALEALGTGLPLILSECPGNDDFKHYPLDGVRWAVPGDPVSLSGQICAWAAAPAISNNHRAGALEYFDCRRALGKLTDFYIAG